jgi:ABC-type uncharacterized transport system ATPase subunit
MTDYSFAKLLEHKGVQSIYNVSLKTLNGKIIGIMGVDFVRSKNTQEDLRDFLKEQSRIIAGYLV